MPSAIVVPYLVRTAEGQLSYGSLEEVKNAYVLGLIDPDDEVQKNGETLWRKAGGIPLLVTAAKERARTTKASDNKWWLIGFVACGLCALYFLTRGQLVLGGAAAVGVVIVLARTTVRASKVRR